MHRSPGLSISVKLILASLLLTLLMASGLGFLSVHYIEDAYESAAEAMDAGPPGVTHRQAMERARDRAVTRILAVAIVCAVIGIVLFGLLGLRLSKRLQLLRWKAERIAAGDESEPLDPRERDEVGALDQGLDLMAERFRDRLQEVRENVALEKEREVARTIQTLVPPNDPVQLGCFSFAGYFQPTSQCGGDWWTYHELGDGKLLLLIGDATAPGLPSAMLTAAAKASCDVACATSGERLDVSTLLTLMNHAICGMAEERLIMTCFASVICLDTREITYANAGHNFPYLYRVADDGQGEFGSLMIRGNRLGDQQTSQYESKTTQLRPGDTLVWFTDGILEAENERAQVYGEKRFRESVRQAAHLSVSDMRNAVVKDATRFLGKARRKDDITMIVGRVS